MPASISVNTDKDVYNEGDPIVVTVTTTPPDAAVVKSYGIHVGWTVDGATQTASKSITVNFGTPVTTDPVVSVTPPAGFAGFLLTEDPDNPGTYTGTIPTN